MKPTQASSILKQRVVFSGIQPSGQLTIGNYLGAIKNWVSLQNSPDFDQKFFCIVDLHALTNKFTIDHNISYESGLEEDTLEMAASLFASGLDPSKCTVFVQSLVPEHSELAWLLGCIGPQSWLNKMVQYKEKQSKNSSLGLYSYPTLQAADILLYRYFFSSFCSKAKEERMQSQSERTKSSTSSYAGTMPFDSTSYSALLKKPKEKNSLCPNTLSRSSGRSCR